jgi:hypothetical protein
VDLELVPNLQELFTTTLKISGSSMKVHYYRIITPIGWISYFPLFSEYFSGNQRLIQVWVENFTIEPVHLFRNCQVFFGFLHQISDLESGFLLDLSVLFFTSYAPGFLNCVCLQIVDKLYGLV